MHSAKSLVALTALASLAVSACAVYPDDRDTTQPNKIKKSAIYCQDAKAPWADCSRNAAAEWYFRPTVVAAPYEAWWTFVGEQGNTFRITWEISEKQLTAYRAYETYKGADGDRVNEPGYRGQPVAAWPISSHFDVWHQYSASTGEQLPVLYESQERPWYEREYIRVDWSRNLISGYGFFMGSKLTTELFGDVKAEPATYAVDDPKDPDYRILSEDYIDVVNREIHTPMTVSGMDGAYFSQNPVSEVAYRYSFMRATKRDYQPAYYPDPSFEKFGYFRLERETYDRERGVTDFKDYLMERWNFWARVHSDKTCSQHSECGGSAQDGVTCDLFEKDADGKGLCTLPYAERGLKPIVYYLSPKFPEERFGAQSCAVVHGWNVAMKKTVASLLGKTYTEPALDDAFEASCSIDQFNPVKVGAKDFDLNTQDIVVLKRNQKNCDAAGNAGKGDRWCYRAGDLRYSMLYWVDQPSAGSPLGYGPVASDPVTGEIIQGNSFIYGGALDSYKSFVGDIFDLVDGRVTEDQLRSGENVRDYYNNMSGNAFPPTFPQNGFRVNDLHTLGDLQTKLQGIKQRAEDLKRLSPAARSPFKTALAGSWVERMLVDNDEWKAANGFDVGHDLSEQELDRISPLRAGFAQQVASFQRIEKLFSEKCVYHANEYTDATVSWLVEDYRRKALDKGITDADELREFVVSSALAAVYRGVTEHEMGHNMGLRHNFEGSFDQENFFDPYFELKNRADLKDPSPSDFGTLPLTPDQYEAYGQAVRAKRLQRDAEGVKLWQYSSIMDYGGQFYSDLRGLGKYDYAAIKFGYGNLVEVFDGAPNATRSNRIDRPYYLGGEKCQTNADCPYASKDPSVPGQTCSASKKVCSSSDKDLDAASHDNPVVQYRFCSDERVADRPFCNRFDEGASSREIVENLIDSYDRNYIFNNFRRYRRYFGPSYAGRIWDRYFLMMGKQFSSLLYQLYYNQDAVLSNGAGSFGDMLSASVTAMNFFERVLTTPDVGAYRAEPLDVVDGNQRYIYRRYNSNCNDSNADLKACLGIGKHFYSVWEQGYYGQIERQARAGTFTDKILAMQALTNREWGNPQANDETYPLSFYDGFQGEMLSLFSGIISSDIQRYAPAVKQHPPTHEQNPNGRYIAYRDAWSGSFYGTDASAFEYNTTPIVKYPKDPADDDRYDSVDLLDPEGRSPITRFYALVFSLQSWPSIYDQTYADYLQVYAFGAPEVRFPADGVETVSYESPRRKKTFMAVQTPDKKSIIYPLVKQAADIKVEYDHYFGMSDATAAVEYPNMLAKYGRICNNTQTPDAPACRNRIVEQLGSELDDRESFLNIAVEVRKLIGLAL